VPQQLIAKYGQTKWTDHLADGSGLGGNLYKLTRWDKAGHLEFTANDSFWGKPAIIQHVNYTLYKDVVVEWSDFAKGKGDVSGVPSTQLSAARALTGVTVQQTPQLSVSFMDVHWGRAPFDDVRMRQAFSLALDRQAIAHDVFQDSQLATIHFVPEGMPGYNADLADAAGRTGKDALTPDLALARRLANAYAAEKCGGALAGCPAVIILRISTSGLEMKLTDLMKQQWGAAFPGLTITFQGIDRSLAPLYTHLDPDGWGADYPDPQDFISVPWNSTSQYNRTAVSIPQVDALRDQADRMTDLAARIPLYQQAEQQLVTQGAAIPYAQPLLSYAVRSHVVGWQVAPTGQTPLAVWRTVYLRG
jgi:peptide/nickel transport system substrate-binding protein/oligopeptide transport system substrate-binding protein